MIELHHGNCLDEMKKIESGSVDMILTDPPYGTTACKWDSIIPLEPMWEQLKRIIKPSGAIVMTASQPFTTTLIASNMKMFKYCWVWAKGNSTGFQLAKKRPLKKHEDIVVFSKKQTTYNPQGLLPYGKANRRGNTGDNWSEMKSDKYVQDWTNYPTSIQFFKKDKGPHPTQKPVALMEYLIKTYTNEGETVLDFTMGSGTTGVACVNTNRSFIGIELDKNYFDIASARIAETEKAAA